MFNLDDGCICFVIIKSKFLGIFLCNQTCLVFGEITFRVMFAGEDPFDTNCFAAGWKRDESPCFILLNALEFFIHCCNPFVFVGSRDGIMIRRLLIICLFDGGVDDFGQILNNDHIG